MRIPASSWVLCALVVVGAAPQRSNLDLPEVQAWFEPTEPQRIVGPISYVGTRGLCVYLITTPQGHILIDGAMPRSAPAIEASIRKLGIEPEEIRILLFTHAHMDHVGTLAHFKKLTGGRVEAMAPEDELLKSGGKTDYLYAEQPKFHFEPVTADRVLKDGDTVSLGGVELTARLSSGHTRGSTTWITTVEEGGKSYLVVFPASTSVNPGTRLVREASYPGIADDYRRTLRMLESLKPDIFLAAHPGFFDFAGKRARAGAEGARAWVDPEGYRRRIAEQKATFESLAAKESPPGLGGTSWRLVQFRGGDDTILTPDDRNKYTIEFLADGGLVARLDCNRGRGAWKSAGPGRLELGPMALTKAMCPPGSLHDQMVKQWNYVRSYVLKDGHLFLSLMADGGIYEFEPEPGGDATGVSGAAPPTPAGGAAMSLEETTWRLIRLGDTPVTAPTSPRQPHLIFDAKSRRVAGSGGCNRLMGSYELNGDRLAFSKMAGTMMACIEGMETEKAFLEALGQVKKWRIEGRELELFDGEGRMLARFEARPAAGSAGVGRNTDGVNEDLTLPDPKKVLLGSGSQNRFIRLESAGRLARPEVEALVAAAVAQGRTPVPTSGRRKVIIRSVSAKQRARRRTAR